MKRLTRAAALVAAAPLLAGCAGAFTDYDLAPNGLPEPEDALRRGLAFEPATVYQEVLDGKRTLPEDDLLRLLYAGTAGRYGGRFDESSRLLDLAAYLSEDRVTRSVSREALSMITSDRALPYTPGRTERLMIPYLAALNYVETGQLDEAAVEARRIEALLDRFDDGTPAEEVPEESRVFHYFAGTVFEAAGEWNAADVAYRRAGPLADSIGTSGARPPGDSLGDVVVLVEHGFVPHRVEQSVVIVLPPAQAVALKDGDVGEKAAAALDAGARILAAAALFYGDRGPYYRDRGYLRPVRLEPWRGERCRDRDHGSTYCEDAKDENPYLLRISWPVLFQAPPAPDPVCVRAGSRTADVVARLDLSAGTRRDFDDGRTALVARTVIRAATKLALTAEIEDQVSEKNEAAGELVGTLFNLGTLLAERADTRSWHLLPGSISIARLRLPAGSHVLTAAASEGGASVPIGTVDVRPGHTTIVSTRLWR